MRNAQPILGTVLATVTAVGVTAQALNAPARPQKAPDIVAADAVTAAELAGVCSMYPSDCRHRADGSIERVVGRRIVPGPDRAVLTHFKTEIGVVTDTSWEVRR